jgi:hypothetical protein
MVLLRADSEFFTNISFLIHGRTVLEAKKGLLQIKRLNYLGENTDYMPRLVSHILQQPFFSY